MARIDDLRDLREKTLGRLASCESDQNFTILGRLLLDTLKQIDELGGDAGNGKAVTALDEFSRRLADRKSGAKAPRRTVAG